MIRISLLSIKVNTMDQSSEAGSERGSLIFALKAEADDALLLAYDTKVHDEVTKTVSQEWDIAEDRNGMFFQHNIRSFIFSFTRITSV